MVHDVHEALKKLLLVGPIFHDLLSHTYAALSTNTLPYTISTQSSDESTREGDHFNAFRLET